MKEIWYIYHGTRGSAGNYMHGLLNATYNARLQARAFVSSRYSFNSPGVIRLFFPLTERTESRSIPIRLIRGLEYMLALIIVFAAAVWWRPVIHLQMTDYSLPTYIFLLFCKCFGLRTVITCHDVFEISGGFPKRKRKMLEKSDLVVVHSAAASFSLKEMVPRIRGKVFIYPHPSSNFDTILNPHKITLASKRLSEILGTDKKWFLFPGYVRRAKGIEILYEAWKELPSNFGAGLVIAGRWCYDAIHLKGKFIQLPRVRIFDQRIDDEELYLLLKRAFFIIFPYLDYTHSGMLHLTAYSGTPVIISDIPLFTEFLPSYKFTFKKGNSEDLAFCLMRCISASELERKIASAELRKAVEDNQKQIPARLMQMKNVFSRNLTY